MRFRFPWLWLTLVATILLSAGGAHAQQWLSDRQRAQGRGLRVGDFELHPGIGSEIGWVSNAALSTPADPSAVLRVAPQFYVSTLGAERTEGTLPKVGFRAGASGSLKHYFGSNLRTDMGVGQDARLVLTPSKIFRAEIFDDFHRTIDPFTQAGAPTAAARAAYDRDQLGAGTRLQLSTPGALFRGGAGYRFDLDHFEDVAFKSNRNRAHTISGDTSWEFLPKTALVWNGQVQLHQFANPGLASAADHYSGTLVSSNLGINGALTERIGFTVLVGYGAGFFSNKNDYDTVIGEVEARWRLVEAVQWTVGYDRQANAAFQGNFTRTDRIRTGLQMLLSGAFMIALKGDLAFVRFGQDTRLAAMGAGNRTDRHLGLNLSGEYRFIDWLAATGELGYIRNFSDYVFPAMGMQPGLKASYDQFSAWFGLRAFL
jgi:hypothetical protein